MWNKFLTIYYKIGRLDKKIKLLSFFSVFTLGEIILRFLGFCNAPLYCNDEYMGYCLIPNQCVRRFGNEYITNEFSMRSNPLQDGEYRILLVGDSVLNGGVQTDQSLLASTILEEEYSHKYKNVRVLNISCGGWGIDNCAGVFKKYGLFDAKMIVIVLNSHDAIGTINSNDVAGRSIHFPDKQYLLAWAELFDRYLIPKIQNVLHIVKTEDDGTNSSEGNERSYGWEYIYNLCYQNNIPLVIYLHADKEELENAEYNDEGKWIIDFAEERGIPVVTDIKTIKRNDYRDKIHLSEDGQRVISDLLGPVIDQFLSGNIE